MDSNTVNGILRAVVPSIVAFVVGKGWLPASLSDSVISWIVAGGTSLLAALWSVKSNTPTAVAAQAAASK